MPATLPSVHTCDAKLPPPQTEPRTPPGSAGSNTDPGCKARFQPRARSTKRPLTRLHPSAHTLQGALHQNAARRAISRRTRPMPCASSQPASGKCTTVATEKPPTAAADESRELKKRSDLDKKNAPHALQKIQRSQEKDWG